MAIERILLVDDEETVLKALTRVLQAKPDQSYAITSLSNPEEALRLVESGEEFDLLISDVRMRPLDGMTLATRIMEKIPGIEIIIISAYLNDELVENFNAKGCRRFIRKPFKMAEVFAALDSIADSSA